ncbi:PD-(D/E)XK nuclease family transposase [uncultured Selenomonas sp.]|uniref:PD-(D/E)XK nuclease family transposase n=1 Tax=uncultured Selenomonas sp. TaxID=159275 RepID=UPI0025E7330A|nr:PD-(D/E)XK nuclease family transposase [uncultured Selenomonas sp.]
MDRRQREKGFSDELFEAQRASYDAEAKNVLACRQVLAPVMKQTVEEFRDVSLRDIEEKCIEGNPYVGAVPVDAGLTNDVWTELPLGGLPQKIHGLQNESNEHKEGRVTFDVLFYARVPKTGRRIKLIINIEAQRAKEDYPMAKRAFYYGCRLISSQKGREFKNDHYEEICKVYTIWICFYVPKQHSTIAHYEFKETVDKGDFHEARENYDLLHVTMIYIGKDEKKSRLMEFLYTIFLENITAEQKAQKLKEKFGMQIDDGLRKGMNRMCNLSDGLVQDAELNTTQKIIRNLLKKGMNLSFISEVTGWTVEQVRAFIESQGLTPVQG